MKFQATKAGVLNRGNPPDAFLTDLVNWGREAPEEIFAPNANPADIYALIRNTLGTRNPVTGQCSWDGPLHRLAALLETMRVHAGFESSWNFEESVDVTNPSSVRDRNRRETGVYQVSFDSLKLDRDGSLGACLERHGATDREDFIAKMKTDHALAFEYYARLVRQSIAWAGPLLDSRFEPGIEHHAKILPCLSVAAMTEFEGLLKSA